MDRSRQIQFVRRIMSLSFSGEADERKEGLNRLHELTTDGLSQVWMVSFFSSWVVLW